MELWWLLLVGLVVAEPERPLLQLQDTGCPPMPGRKCCGVLIASPEQHDGCCEQMLPHGPFLRPINSTNFLCCGGIPVQRSNSQEPQECCGQAAMDTKTQFCCKGQLYSKAVLGLPSSAKPQCCHAFPLNLDPKQPEVCCKGRKFLLEAGHEGGCCGEFYWNRADADLRCCFGTTLQRAADEAQQCCGERLFHSATQKVNHLIAGRVMTDSSIVSVLR